MLVRDVFGGGGILSPDAPGGGPLGGCQLLERVDDSGGGTESERAVDDSGGAPEILTPVVDRLPALVALKGDSICTGLEWIGGGLCWLSTVVGIRECDKLTGKVSPRTGGESFRLGVGASSGGVAVGTVPGGRWLALGYTGAGSTK